MHQQVISIIILIALATGVMTAGERLLLIQTVQLLHFPIAILRDPETKITPAGGSVPFVCTGEGEVHWFIDNNQLTYAYELELENDGFTFTPHYYPTYTNLTMTAPAINSRNGTKIRCKAFSSSETVASEVAWLWIVCTFIH